jgi:hypothetical protein
MKDFLNFKKGIKTFNSEDYLYSPKLIISLVAMGINEDHCDVKKINKGRFLSMRST